MFIKYLSIIFVAIICFKLTSISFTFLGVPREKCSIKDSECLRNQIQKSVETFTAGIPEVGVENLNKMILDSVLIKKDGLIYEIRNIEVDGLKNTVIDRFWIDTNLKYIHITFHTTLNLDCDYTAEGFLFTLPVSGAGKAHIIKKNVITEMLLLFEFKKDVNGKEIIDLKDYRYGFDTAGGSVYRFENLFNGDKTKSDIVHEFINRNWRTTSVNFSRYLFDKINDKIFDAIKKYLASIPLEDLAILN